MQTGNIKKIFGKYVTLNILGMIGLSCYILADTFFIAQYMGANGLTSLNLAIPVYSFIHGTGLLIGMGGATRYSISKPKGIFTQSIYFSAIMSGLFLIAGILLPNHIATLLGADSSTHQMTSTYLRVLLCFSPAFILNNVMICFVRNDGHPKLSMAAMLTGSFSNIILDYIFIFPLKMGMFGAALATGIAPILSLLILSIHIFLGKSGFRLCKGIPHIKKLLDIASLGASALITELSSGIVIIVINSIILQLADNIGVAAYGIIANAALVAVSIFTGLSQGIQPILSNYYGAGKINDAKKIYRYATIVSIIISVLIYAVTFIFTEPIVRAFNGEQNIHLAKIAEEGLRIYFTAFLFTGINSITAIWFSSVDRPSNAFLISFLRGFAVIIPMALLLSALFGMAGVWLTMTVTELIVLIMSALLLKRGNSLQKRNTKLNKL